MRNAGRSIAAVVTMALGIGAATAIFSLIRPAGGPGGRAAVRVNLLREAGSPA